MCRAARYTLLFPPKESLEAMRSIPSLAVLLACVTFTTSASADSPSQGKQVLPPVVRTAQSGPWSAPATWEGGKVPTAGTGVLVRTGHRVLYDIMSDDAIRAINVAGTLTFATDKDTRLNVGLIKIQDSDTYCEEGFDYAAHSMEPD